MIDRDQAAMVSEPLERRFVMRDRLRKQDPESPHSRAVKPIVDYLHAGTPEPVRSALLDGARWRNVAFEAASYQDAFRVELMPPGVDPMDARYNVIRWVQRATRGWS